MVRINHGPRPGLGYNEEDAIIYLRQALGEARHYQENLLNKQWTENWRTVPLRQVYFVSYQPDNTQDRGHIKALSSHISALISHLGYVRQERHHKIARSSVRPITKMHLRTKRPRDLAQHFSWLKQSTWHNISLIRTLVGITSTLFPTFYLEPNLSGIRDTNVSL